MLEVGWADTVEWLGRKPSWISERGSELSSGYRRRSKILTAGQRSTQISWLIGFGNKDYNCVFQNDRNIAMVIERL